MSGTTFRSVLSAAAADAGLSKDAALRFWVAFRKRVVEVAGAQEFVLPGLVAFRRGTRKERSIKNLVTGKPMTLPLQRVVLARVSGTWRNRG